MLRQIYKKSCHQLIYGANKKYRFHIPLDILFQIFKLSINKKLTVCEQS